MKASHIKQLLKRYVAGQCTPEEQLLVEEWYRQQQEANTVYTAPSTYPDEDALLQRIQQPRTAKRVAMPVITLLKIAASLILLSGAGYVLQKLWPVQTHWQEAVAQDHPLQLRLSDSSVVWLNAGSRLRYPDRFNGPQREVELLTGEACLNVAQDPAHPFMIRSGSIRTQVLGTIFNVRAYEKLAIVQVTVQQGKVAVQADSVQQLAGRQVILLPDEQLTFYAQQQDWKKEHRDAANISAWTTGRLLFNNERLDLIAMQLEQKYGVHITFADNTLPAYRITAGFEAADTLRDVLDALSLANKLHYTIDHHNIIFSKQ
ncbi:FecR family protein [Chitinophaga rupis]|uniref:FecR family protein n=1 Tax=Chitinophaga rupis TaxID=573321 RepID=A0A1H7RLN8_9BACT|nr:FecR domain-containing protein [Chitinophaga rupis]SEL61156.1 FecR family protein [Chitinophaga rupis]